MFVGCSSPCSTGIAADIGWSADMADIKGRSSYEESKDSLPFQVGAQQGDSDSCGSSVLIDSTLQMMGFGLSSSSTSDWNQPLIRSNGILEEGMDCSQTQKDWSPRSYASPGEDSSITSFKPINQDFSLSLEQQRLNSVTSSGYSTISCQFPMDSVSYGYSTTLLQTLFQSDPQTQSQQQSLFNNNRSINYMSAAATYATESSPSWPKLAPLSRSSLPKQLPNSSLNFTNNAPFWNASATGVNDVKAGFLPSRLQSEFLLQTYEEKPNCPGLTKKTNTEEARNSGSTMKKGLSSDPPLLKRPRIETPSPLPSFKVRKEKLGDRITALQQLVSPFGKTDTASVLHEAIEYIKFLHEQVNVLSTPYMKQAAASIQQQQSTESPEGPKQDLRSLGLCLVPISSTFPVANENTVDFWTPTFGGTFR
ncbi:hypothetical protein like AT1G61660 [Hibiscus trionum]|nr:hypothetical protein like AT1G61660 [Hibiscus trionum]